MNDNSSLSDTIRQDSDIDATEPPTESDLDSRFKRMSLSDGVEMGVDMLTDATDLMPVVGSIIKAGLGVGKHSKKELKYLTLVKNS